MSKPIIDSALSDEEILRQNPNRLCPEEIMKELVVVQVTYYSFDQKVHSGQIVVHKDLANDVRGAFELLLAERFPIQSVIPISDARFNWSDEISTAENNSSAFNYRFIRNTTQPSVHSEGRAVDINPKLNPYFPGNEVYPPNAIYDESIPGTITANSKLVRYFKDLGWRWDGELLEDLDYQHFEKISY